MNTIIHNTTLNSSISYISHNEYTIIDYNNKKFYIRPRHDSGRANCMVVCSWPFLRFDLGGGVGRRGRQGFGDAAEVRGDGLAASVARGGGLTAGRGAGPWRGSAGRGSAGRGGELSHLAFVKFTWHLPLLIIKQLTHEKGAGEHNLVPPGTAMCLGVA